MLYRLLEYAKRVGLVAEPGFSPKLARWAIVCDRDGNFEKVVELGAAGEKKNPGMRFPKCPDYTFSEMKAGGEDKAHFFLESAATVTLLEEDESSEKTRNKHEYFRRMLREAAKKLPELEPVSEMLGQAPALRAIRADMKKLKARPTQPVTFRVGQRFPLSDSYWHEWWREHRADLRSRMAKAKRTNTGEVMMRCFLTGEMVKPALVLGKIRGLSSTAGGMSVGNTLVGFDKEAFRSYGLEHSHNAAMSETAWKACEDSLNRLLSDPGANHFLAGMHVVHWYNRALACKDPFDQLFGEEQLEEFAQDQAAKLLQSVRTGERSDLGDAEYYILLLSGTGGRVMVRGWQEGRFEELAASVAQWFSDLKITSISGTKEAKPPKIESVITSILPERNDRRYDDWIKPVTRLRQTLWEAAVRGRGIPREAVAQIIVQFRSFCVSGGMDDLLARQPKAKNWKELKARLYCRMALIRAYHLRKNVNMQRSGDMNVELKPYLNPDHPASAYHCGRLMAVLAQLQRAALGDVGANVIQRYFAAASTTPALVFGRLVRNAEFHKDKLAPGLAYLYERRLAEIMSKLHDRIPPTLTLEEQSLFALGYYQQIAATFAEIAARANRSSGNNKEED